MVEITKADRAAAASIAVLVEMRELILAGRADHHAEPFARHRIAASEDMKRRALAALKTAQFDPAPYTKGRAAIERLEP